MFFNKMNIEVLHNKVNVLYPIYNYSQILASYLFYFMNKLNIISSTIT